MRAYFDESGSEDPHGYFGVAGFVGSDDQWRVFDWMWKEALKTTGASYLHMREFAHSVDAFTEWKDDNVRREQLMAGVVAAVLESELIPVGSAMRVGDFNALTDKQRERLQSPYFCCLQDVLFGFALNTLGEDPGVELHVTGDRHGQHEEKARKLHRALRQSGEAFANLSDELNFADMQQTFGLQAADLLAYEMVKELRNQDERSEDRMRWPLDQILSEPESPRGKMLKYITAEMLQAQAAGQWNRRRGNVLQRSLDESLRILRDKSIPFKRLFHSLSRRMPQRRAAKTTDDRGASTTSHTDIL